MGPSEDGCTYQQLKTHLMTDVFNRMIAYLIANQGPSQDKCKHKQAYLEMGVKKQKLRLKLCSKEAEILIFKLESAIGVRTVTKNCSADIVGEKR